MAHERRPRHGRAARDGTRGVREERACLPLGVGRARLRDDPRDAGEVWTYRDPESGDLALLLFSDAAHKPESLPPTVALQSPAWLRAFLGRFGFV